MILTETSLPGVLIVEPRVIADSRGWFMETYSKTKTPQIDCEFVQDNHSYSTQKGVLRGIHFQYPPMEQAKLIRCTRGAIMDYVVDLRYGSETYKRWISVELTAQNKRQLFVPKGFGHAYITLADDTEVQYKADNYYSPEHDGVVLWSDSDIGIVWAIDDPILSDKDKNAPLLKEIRLKEIRLEEIRLQGMRLEEIRL